MRVSHIIKGTRPITAELALLFGRAFDQSPQYWLNLQTASILKQRKRASASCSTGWQYRRSGRLKNVNYRRGFTANFGLDHYILKLISYVFTLIEHGDLKFDWFYDDWARPTYQIVRFLVIVTALISAYPYIPGSSSEAFQGVGLVLGAIISFASSSAISNIVAGVILTYTRAFRLNDRIKVGDTVGDVVEKTLLVTRVKTIKHVVITIPNSLVMGTQIVNYSTSAADGQGVILHTSVTIGYDVPWKQVEALLIAAALRTEKLLQTPPPFVFQTSLDDWYVAYEINAYTKKPERMAEIYSELHKHIQEEFDAAGVEIMSPHYMTLRDGNASTVPSVLGASNYVTPAFSVSHIAVK